MMNTKQMAAYSGGDEIAQAIAPFVEAGQLSGATALVWRDDAEVACAHVGWRDVEAKLPVERETIFRIASLTKPITCTAALMLWEEGRFALDDPISRWAPELCDMRVLRSMRGALDDTVPALRSITFDDLLTHRSGLTYGDFHPGAIAAAFREALGGDIDSHVAPNAWIAALAQLPLVDQPGATFHYGHSTDLLGLLIARMEDAPLGDVLKRRIFDPLGMADTGFTVPLDKRGRRAASNGFDDHGHLIRLRAVPAGAAWPERPDDMEFQSGGQGLWSTVDDYLRFARMFVGQGTVDGVRLLRPDTLATMASNHLTPAQRANAQMFGHRLFAQGHGFGMGVAVVLELDKAAPIRCGGGIGAVGWPGAYGGWWQADPNDRSVLVFLTHNMVELHQLANGIGLDVYSAITQFQALAAKAGSSRPSSFPQNANSS
jgi:CubicO group peptidase (beta-lactamase class C family)